MSPHETIARMRAYQAGLQLVRSDVQEAQKSESSLERLDSLITMFQRRYRNFPGKDAQQIAAQTNEECLATLMRYADELTKLNAQLERVIENPALFPGPSPDTPVHFTRIRFLLRRALYRNTLELGWFVARMGDSQSMPQIFLEALEPNTRTETLLERIGIFSRALHYHTTQYRPLVVHTIFQDFDVF